MLKRLAAPLVSVVSFAFTANGYRPLTKDGYGSVFAFAYGLFASELPLQTSASSSRRWPHCRAGCRARIRRFSWLMSALSGLGLLGLRQLGHRANEPLTAALDAGLGADRRTESGDLWKRPAPGGATAKKPGVARMLRIYRDYAHDGDISYGERRLQEPSRHLATARPRPRRAGAGVAAGSRRRLDGGKQTRTGASVDEPFGRAGLGLRGDQLPAQPALHLARSHRRRQTCDRLDEGAHRRLRRRPGLDRHHRGLGGRALVFACRTDPQRPAVSAGVRGRRHPGGCGRPVLRRLRLHPQPAMRYIH